MEAMRRADMPMRERAMRHFDVAQSLHGLDLLLAGLGEGMSHRVQVADAAQAGVGAPALSETHFLLPASFAARQGDEAYQCCLRAIAHAVAHLRYSPARRPAGALKPMGLAVVAAIEDSRVERLLMRECPGLQDSFVGAARSALASTAQHDGYFPGLLLRLNLALLDPAYTDAHAWVSKARELFEQQAAQDLENYDAFRGLASILSNDLGQLRIQFNARDYRALPEYRDDNTYLWDFPPNNLPPPEAISLQAEFRSSGDAAVAQAELTPAGGEPVSEVDLATYSYPEWDFRLDLLRQGWCTLREQQNQALSARGGVDAAPTWLETSAIVIPGKLRRRRMRRVSRQWEGDELDLNAVVESIAERRAGQQPEQRVFRGYSREDESTSMLLLLDASRSTGDALLAGSGNVLQIEKRAAMQFVAALLAAGDRVAVDAFCSDTRERVWYQRLLDFGEAPGSRFQSRMQGLVPEYSTRMGAAVRHAATRVAQEQAASASVLVVTDGSPSDVDVVAEDYLVEDARVAVLEARRRGVNVYGIILDDGGEKYAARIFGIGGYRIMSGAEMLPAEIIDIYARLAWRR